MIPTASHQAGPVLADTRQELSAPRVPSGSTIHSAARGIHPLFFVLLIVTSLHSISPVADLVAASQIANAGILGGMIAILAFHRNDATTSERDALIGSVWPLLAMLVFCVAHALATGNSWGPDARYCLALAVACLMLVKLDMHDKLRALTWMVVVFTCYFFYMIDVHLAIHAGLIDLKDWAARDLAFIHEQNPIIIRDGYDFDFFFPLYSVVIAQGAGAQVELGPIAFYRLTGPFMEPTDVAFTVIPLMFYSLGSRNLRPWGFFITGVLGIAVFWAFATSGFIAIVLAVLLYFSIPKAGKRTNGIRWLRMALSAVLVVFAFLLIRDPEGMIALLGEHKLNQFLYFSDQAAQSSDLYLRPSPFGIGFDKAPAERMYGALAVLLRHGWIGSAVMVMFLLSHFRSCWRLCRRSRAAIGLMGLSALVLVLKYPEIVNLYFLVIYVVTRHAALAHLLPMNRSKN